MAIKNYIQPLDVPVTIQSEEELIQQSQKNPKAFKKLYERYFGAIFHFILKRINDKEITADITQQVFLNALISIKQYEYRGLPFSAYLYRIAINECNGYFRSHSASRFIVLNDEYSEKLMDELGVEDDFDEQMVKLKAAFHHLNANEVELIELRFFEKHSFKEVAQILAITENLAKVKTYRLLSKMKKMMVR